MNSSSHCFQSDDDDVGKTFIVGKSEYGTERRIIMALLTLPLTFSRRSAPEVTLCYKFLFDFKGHRQSSVRSPECWWAGKLSFSPSLLFRVGVL